MPQLEQINTFAAQIFWLFVCFGIVYFFIARIAAPKLGKVIESRENTISSNINLAETYKNNAVSMNSEFEKKSSASRAEAMNMIAASSKNANTLYDKGIADTEADIKKHINASEKDIMDSKNKAAAELSKNTATYVEEIIVKLTGTKADKQTIEKIVSKINS